jgi:hypothetical protein
MPTGKPVKELNLLAIPMPAVQLRVLAPATLLAAHSMRLFQVLTLTVAPGLAPVDVSFNLSIEGFADPNFTDWTLNIDSTGEPESSGFGGLPFNYTQTITKAGNYTAIFSATDGEGSANLSLNYTIVGAPVIPPIVLEGDVAFFCGTVQGCYVVGAEGCIGLLTNQNGFDCFWIEVPSEAIGKPYTTTSNGDVDVDFRDVCSTTSSSVGLNGAEGHDAGTVPAALVA